MRLPESMLPAMTFVIHYIIAMTFNIHGVPGTVGRAFGSAARINPRPTTRCLHA